ncbi:hypothetical protein DL96DRAFT_398601 [Flagelloscypha sp. PMI_526]|nr:hypothetical protein DL96DRAFT_398601 [Flagelloscypha sp. PMI_526]
MSPPTHSSTHSPIFFLSWFSISFFCALLSSGYAARNISIDDTMGDVVNFYSLTFTPPEVWDNSTCSKCSVPPDASLSFSGTYRNALLSSGGGSNTVAQVRVPFVGTSVFVFLAVSDRRGGPDTNCNFTIDGQTAGSFTWSSGEGGTNEEYIYSMLGFSKEGLSDQEHLMTISSGQPTSNRDNLLNVDRVVYTISEDAVSPSNDPSSPSTTPTAGSSETATPSKNPKVLIFGVVVGSLSAIALVLVIISLWFQRRRRAIAASQTQTQELKGAVSMFPFESQRITDVESSPVLSPSINLVQAPRETDDVIASSKNVEQATTVNMAHNPVDERLAQLEAEISEIRNHGALPPPYQSM